MTDETPSPRPLRYHLERAREETSEKLQQAYVEGYVTDDELDERLEMVSEAEEMADLQRLIADLPEGDTALVRAESTELVRARSGDRQRQDTMRAIFSGIERNGTWSVAEILEVQAIFGGAELDFRDADLQPGETTILRVGLIFGGIEVTLPPGVRVENQATPIFGGVSTSGVSEEGENPHVLRVEGVILFGGIELQTRAPKKRKRLGR